MNVQSILPPQVKEIPPFVWYPALFSPPECAALITLGETALTPGQIGNGIANEVVTDPDYRQVLTRAIAPDEAPWAYQRLAGRVMMANHEFFHYDVHGLYEQLIFLRYDYDPVTPGKYKWHQDTGGGMSSLRKLSTVSQLSTPDQYSGCRLHMFTNMEFDPYKIEQGDTVIFPSWTPHCVTPIESGRRYALVSWVTGNPFR